MDFSDPPDHCSWSDYPCLVGLHQGLFPLDLTPVKIHYFDFLHQRIKEELVIEPGGFLPSDVQIETLVQAGKTRLRPVLLTAITIMLGLIPLAVGFNFNFFTVYSSFDPLFS